jgi:transposase InsO family protein
MPWAERSIVSLRKEFVLRALSREKPLAELCREYGVSRKTAYKWLQRFRDRGVPGLVDGSRRPHRSPTATADAIRNEIVVLKQAHPKWGAKKLRELLVRTHGDQAPSKRTVERVLRDFGLIRRYRRRRPSALPGPRPNVVVDAPNALWTVDFKGWWRTVDGKRCEPLTIRDAFSRYVLAMRVLPSTREQEVRPVFEELFKRYGLPKAIQSDNGTPFASASSLAWLTRLSAWWMALGIEVVRSRPGCPQDNGGHERMHLDVSIELEASGTRTALDAQQAAFDQWVAEFNHVRPHEALGMRTPSEIYVPSSRRMPALVLITYPKQLYAHRVDVFGQIQHRRWRVYVTMTLAHHLVAVEERQEGKCLVWFCDLLLGSFVYRRERRLVPWKPVELGQAPSSNPTAKGAGGVVPRALARRVPKAV